jgi:hypothetical protein
MDLRRKNIMLAAAIAVLALLLYAYAILKVVTSSSSQ